MVKFQVQMEDGKLLFTDDFEVEDVSFDGSVIYAEVNDLKCIDFNGWKRTYRKYQMVDGRRELKSVFITY